MAHGGARPGAGRKPKDRTPEGYFETAQEYLEAVVCGLIAPDAVRVQAARTLIGYQETKRRAPKRSPSPVQLEAKERRDRESAVVDDFEKKAARIRRKHEANK